MRWLFRPWSFVLAAPLFFGPSSFAQDELTAAIHVHSSISSGEWEISRLAELAREEKIDVLVITDLLWERYEYGIQPLQNWLKFAIERGSILKEGAQSYLDQVTGANQRVPEVLTMGGLVATPFYYWSGGVWPGPLVLNNRGKDLLVLGLDHAREIESLPVLGRPSSPYDAYHGPQYQKPYQKLIDAVPSQKGFIIWSHPNIEESRRWKLPVLQTDVRLHTSDYSEDVLETEGYQGLGIYSWELLNVLTNASNVAWPGNLWDQLLKQHAEGTRKQPVWIVGEVDYTGLPEEKTKLSSVMNILRTQDASKTGVMSNLQSGHFYVVLPNQGRGGRLKMEAFESMISPEGLWHLDIQIGHTRLTGLEVQLTLVRDGKMIEEKKGQIPFQTQVVDMDPPQDKLAYYRIIVTSDEGDRLLSNPIFKP